MLRTAFPICAALFFSSILGSAQTWEIGAMGGYGWYQNPSITNPIQSGQAGFPSRPAVGVVFGDNAYNYVGGEIRWLFRFGGPQVTSNGIREAAAGYTNAVTYEFLFHATPRESKVRPFVAAGAGIKAYTNTFRDFNQQVGSLAILGGETAVEPAISVGAGVKYVLPKHVQLRLDFHTIMTPLPTGLIRPLGAQTRVHGWVYDFLPLLEVGYVF